MYTFAEPTEWWLDCSSLTLATPGRSPQATPSSGWNADGNERCLQAVLTWLQTEYAPQATGWLDASALPALWEIVNGVAIVIGTQRLVLIPSENMGIEALEVPQEWVDIPSWSADYYLALQINRDDNTIRGWGYATHAEVKTLASYDASDRTYTLAAHQLTRDLATLTATWQWCPNAPTKAAIAPLPELANAQADQLMQRLGAATWPRLAVPFRLWGALIESAAGRQRLYEQRLGQQRWPSLRVRLTDWWHGAVATGWQELAAVLSPRQLESTWRSARSRPTDPPNLSSEVSRIKVLEFGDRPGVEQVALLVGVAPLNDIEVSIGIQIGPVGHHPTLPNDVQLRLLNAVGTEVGQASATITETIQLQFTGERGEQFSVEVACGDRSITESFEI